MTTQLAKRSIYILLRDAAENGLDPVQLEKALDTLYAAKIDSLGVLKTKSDADLLRLKSFGDKQLDLIVAALKIKGEYLANDEALLRGPHAPKTVVFSLDTSPMGEALKQLYKRAGVTVGKHLDKTSKEKLARTLTGLLSKTNNDKTPG